MVRHREDVQSGREFSCPEEVFCFQVSVLVCPETVKQNLSSMRNLSAEGADGRWYGPGVSAEVGSDSDSQVQPARQEKDTSGKLAHLASALNLPSTRIAASSCATVKALKVR